MGELKATSSGEIRARNALLGYWWYEQSEADQVITELKHENERLKKQLSCKFVDDCLRIRQDERGLRHQKHKRCLAMVRCCMADNHTLSQVTLNEATNHLQWLFNENFFVKWAARWSKIADKFNDGETK